MCRDQTYSLSSFAANINAVRLHANLLQAGMRTFHSAGYMHSQSTANMPAELNDRLPRYPNISMLSPELQQQWHVDRNMHLGAIRVKPRSTLRVLWHCDKCPAGQPHIWIASVKDRTRGTQCPYCCNREVCPHNSLATVAPGMAKYWNHSKNTIAPHQVVAGSGLRAHWKCPTCKLEWQASIEGRVQRAAGCPDCCHSRQVSKPQPTFAEAQPACMAEWDHERNQEEGFYPDVITLGSNKQVHWICLRCPRGQPHRWAAAPRKRIGQGSRCAVCAGRQACACNSLDALFPSVAAEFDVDKNGFAASHITAHSDKLVWWRNAQRGSWAQAVNVRTNKRRPRKQKV